MTALGAISRRLPSSQKILYLNVQPSALRSVGSTKLCGGIALRQLLVGEMMRVDPSGPVAAKSKQSRVVDTGSLKLWYRIRPIPVASNHPNLLALL